MATITGGIGNDTIAGTAGPDLLRGLAGNDSLNGYGGSDTLLGGAGNDILEGGQDDDTVRGGAGDDYFVHQYGADLLDGGDGNDRFYVSYQGTGTILGGAGIDTLDATSGLDMRGLTSIVAVERLEVDTSYVIASATQLAQFTAIDSNVASPLSPYNFYLIQGAGDLTGRFVDAQRDMNINGYYATAGLNVVIGVGYGGRVNLTGSSYSDTVTGGDGTDFLTGAQGDDVLRGGNGDDYFVHQYGSDSLDGGAGNDRFYVSYQGGGTIVGGAGIDTLDATSGLDMRGLTSIVGVERLEVDTSYVIASATQLAQFTAIDSNVASPLSPYNFYLIQGAGDLTGRFVDAQRDMNINGYYATSGLNVVIGVGYGGRVNLTGTSYSDTVTGGDGADYLTGGQGNDVLRGGNGDDYFVHQYGSDSLDGGAGNDRFYVSYQGTGTIVGGAGIDTLDATSGLDMRGLTSIVGVERLEVDSSYIIASATQLALFASIDSNVASPLTPYNFYLIQGAGDLTGRFVDALRDLNISGYYATSGLSFIVGPGFGGRVSLDGSSFGDTATGGDGNDVMSGNAGGDSLSGGAGNDTLSGGTGVDTLRGGDGDDRLNGGTDVDSFDGGLGSDTIDYSYSGTAGAINLATQSATIEAETFTSIENAIGSQGANVITGSGAANILDGQGGADSILGGGGNDTIAGGSGSDTLNGEAGVDTVDYSYTATAGAINLALQTTTIDTDTLAGFENAIGSQGANVITGSGAANILDGQGGDDSILGGGGNDTISGGAGVDTVDGQVGIDTISFVNEAGGIINLATSTATIDGVAEQILNFENVIGSDDGDTIIGSAIGNRLEGLVGNDTISGGDGADTILGGDDNDVLNGEGGIDSLDGGAGDDTYIVDAAGDTIAESANNGSDTVRSSISYTLAAGNNVENLVLLGAATTGTGNELGNTITGNGLANTLNGGGGADRLIGGLGNDTLVGGAAVDTLAWTATTFAGGDVAAAVIDVVTGGLGDRLDFTAALEALLRSGGVTLASRATDLVVGGTFTAGAGGTNVRFDAVNDFLEFDLNGNGGAFQAGLDFRIDLSGAGIASVTYSAADDVFLLA